MSNLHVKALEILNNYSTIVSHLHNYNDYENRGGYIYFETETSAFGVELESIRVEGKSLEYALRNGNSLTPTQVSELAFEQNPYNGIPDEYTPEDVAEFIEKIKENFWYNYHLINGMSRNVQKQLSSLNEESGQVLVNVDIIDVLLQGPREFYESSTC